MQMNEVGERLGRIEAKLDTLLDNDTDKETRLRTIEHWRSWATGAFAALSVVVGVVLKIVL